MINKILIFGAKGMLGSYLVKYLTEKYHVIPISRTDYDVIVDNNVKLENLFKKHNVDHNTLIINAIGVIPQASKNYDLTNRFFIKINSVFPHKLAYFTEKYHANMIHATTDCVFSGNRGNYLETDIHDEINIYGVTKSEGEPENCTVIRTSIIGEEKYNFRSLLEWVKSNKGGKINGYTNHIWNGITCLEYAKLIDHLIINNLFWVGVRHIYSPNNITKCELVKHINDIYKLDITIIPVQNGSLCDKSLRSIYDQIYQVPDLKDQIIELYNFSN